MTANRVLSGMNVLVVEDAFLLARDLADELLAAGCAVVGPVPTVNQALERIDGLALDGAVLDINLRGERSFPLAEHLAARGVPLLFLTGYDSATVFPEQFREIPRLSKPVDRQAFLEAVARFRGTGNAS